MADYDLLMKSGLYEELVSNGRLIPHSELKNTKISLRPDLAHKILRPVQIPFVSYPYEWSFSQLKDAALLTLDIQKTALQKGMSLKDASAYNIQFINGRPVFIDTGSFEEFTRKKYWQAYKQFCQHFLAPLALMAYRDLRLNLMLRDFIDGIPLDLAVTLLPRRGKARPGLFLHLYLHSAAQQKYADRADALKHIKPTDIQTEAVAHKAVTPVIGLVESLERAIKAIRLSRTLKTEWGDYYTFTNYSDKSFQHKERVVEQFAAKSKAATIFDLGGNDGTFSRSALKGGAKYAICFDIDPLAVEKNYKQIKKDGEPDILPLLLDLTNPSPGIGWANAERSTIAERTQPAGTLVLALALIHHLSISNNVPFDMLADYFSRLGRYLVIEFVPKGDSKVEKLLSTREDIFDTYDEDHFEQAMGKRFKLIEKKKVAGSKRHIYLYRTFKESR